MRTILKIHRTYQSSTRARTGSPTISITGACIRAAGFDGEFVEVIAEGGKIIIQPTTETTTPSTPHP